MSATSRRWSDAVQLSLSARRAVANEAYLWCVLGGRAPRHLVASTEDAMSARQRCRTVKRDRHSHPTAQCDFCRNVAVFHWRETYPDLLLCAQDLEMFPEVVTDSQRLIERWRELWGKR